MNSLNTRYKQKPIIHFSNFMTRITVDWDSHCWNWKGHKTEDGYGRVGFKGKLRMAHRLAKYLYGDITWETFKDRSLVTLHECDNPACVNPYHLRMGTQLENIADRVRKGRCAKHLENRNQKGQFAPKLTEAFASKQKE